ncbi:MAG TPA: hypothetical protein VEB00_07095 [Clostridia bacterium]|nr:hypothetical protein [Clostridia bacterium]
MEVLFCTIASKYRLHQCVALYHSLKHFMAEAALVVLAVDEECKKVFDALKLPGVTVISAEELEDAELKELKRQRNASEYCWTLKPVLLLNLYESYKDIKIFAYLDSDLFFFDSPMRLFKGSKNWSVLFTTHKVNRKANGGFVAFMRGRHAYKALKWWKEGCLEWCYYRNDNGRFADQGYLDFMRARFKGVTYLDLPGANVATWNYFNSDLVLRDGNIYVGKKRLVFYHFSGLRLKKISGSTALYGAEAPCLVCGIYIKALRAAIFEIEEVDREIAECFYLGL